MKRVFFIFHVVMFMTIMPCSLVSAGSLHFYVTENVKGFDDYKLLQSDLRTVQDAYNESLDFDVDVNAIINFKELSENVWAETEKVLFPLPRPFI